MQLTTELKTHKVAYTNDDGQTKYLYLTAQESKKCILAKEQRSGFMFCKNYINSRNLGDVTVIERDELKNSAVTYNNHGHADIVSYLDREQQYSVFTERGDEKEERIIKEKIPVRHFWKKRLEHPNNSSLDPIIEDFYGFYDMENGDKIVKIKYFLQKDEI